MNEPLREEEVTEDISAHLDDVATDSKDSEESTTQLPKPSATESLINALIEAGPEVAEHVVKAAQELILAVQTIVDAADQSIREQQDLRTESTPESSSSKTDDTVRHLDLAE